MKFVLFLCSLLFVAYANSDDAKKAVDTAEKVVDAVQAVTSIKEMEKQIEQIKKDIKEDGHNYKINLAYTYYAYEPFRRLETYEEFNYGGTNAEIRFATLAVSLLPNTWNIKLSTTIIQKDSFGNDENDGGPLPYRYDTKKDTEFTNFYMKPINRSWGDVGFGYARLVFNNTFDIPPKDRGTKYYTVVDVPGTPSYTNVGVNFTIEATRYYMTYNIPGTSWIPSSFGFKYEYEESDSALPLTQDTFAQETDATIHRIGLGIAKTEEELQSGVSFKKLYYSEGKNNYKFFNYQTNKDVSIDLTTQKVELEIAIAKRWESGSILYTIIGAGHESFENIPDPITELTFTVGSVF